MKVPLSWLREYVDVDVPVKDLAFRLTMAGLEVEDVHAIGADWSDIRIARVQSVEPHPRARALHVAELDLGDRTRTVVTAATNLRPGALVPHVAPGGRLPTGEVGTKTFMGITSEGMVCGGDELHVSPDREGIYILEDSAASAIGQPFAAYLDETVLDIYVTVNRPDCMSIVGIAREVHALLGGAFRPPTPARPTGTPAADALLTIRIEDPVGCPRFAASIVRGVAIGPSPHAIQRRLYFSGVRPISNVVDVTNYVMLELGEPLHAFDWHRLNDDTIVIRRAFEGERLRTLDGEERTLTAEMMVVADSHRARSLAGVMGGEDSEIQPQTTDVLLEAATWDRASVRRSSSAFGLQSEAARRYGRGIDPELCQLALYRAADLTLQLAGGTTANGIVDQYPGRVDTPTILLTPDRVRRMLGFAVPREQIAAALRGLEFGVEDAGEALRVHVPGHRRFDVAHPADLVEDVARVVGFEHVPTTTLGGRVPAPRPDGDQGFSNEVQARRALAGAGLQEVITYSLVSAEPNEQVVLIPADASAQPLRLANPLSAQQSVLRSALLGSVLATARANLRHHGRLALFELSRTWRGPIDPLPDERRHLAVVLTGPREQPGWSTQDTPFDFFDVKGVVDTLCATFGQAPTYQPAQSPWLHPGRSASVHLDAGATLLGLLGQLHPARAERLDLGDRAVLVAELDVELLFDRQPAALQAVTPPRFPSADRDVAVVLDEAVPHADAEQVIVDAAGPLLSIVHLFDVYRGDPIPPGKRSLAFALRYQASDRTLGDAEIDAAHARVEDALRAQLGAHVRGRE